MEPNRSGNSGRYLRVLNWLSEYGLSSETCGRLWVLVTPRSASISATGLEVIEVPRSAWMVRVPATMDCFSQVAAISRLANSAVSRPATIQPDGSEFQTPAEDAEDRGEPRHGFQGAHIGDRLDADSRVLVDHQVVHREARDR